MSTQIVADVQVHRGEGVETGVICKSDGLYGLTRKQQLQVECFLLDWKDDTALAVALHLDKLTASLILMLVDCGRIRAEQLQKAFEILLSCWSRLGLEAKNHNGWETVHARLRELAQLKDPDTLFPLFPMLDPLLHHHGLYGSGQSRTRHVGSFSTRTL